MVFNLLLYQISFSSCFSLHAFWRLAVLPKETEGVPRPFARRLTTNRVSYTPPLFLSPSPFPSQLPSWSHCPWVTCGYPSASLCSLLCPWECRRFCLGWSCCCFLGVCRLLRNKILLKPKGEKEERRAMWVLQTSFWFSHRIGKSQGHRSLFRW